MTPAFPSRLPDVGTTIFTVMSQLAHEYKAVNLAQGFPDFPVSPKLIDLVQQAMRDGYNQYAPMPGWPALRNVLAQKLNTLYGCMVQPDTDITITPGATYGIYTALTTILQKGDEVIVLEPAYDSYIPNIEINGARAVCVPLCAPNYSVDWTRVQQAIRPHTRAIIINTPHNPSGYVWTAADMQALIACVENTGILVISDEVYEHLTFDERPHESVLKYPALAERSFVVYSFGKVFHATGWKMGYVVAPEILMREFRKVHQFLSFTAHTPSQVALAAYLEQADTYLSLPAFYQEKRDYFLQQLLNLPFTLHHKTGGSYFQLLGYEQISDMPDQEFARWMTKEIGVAVIPVSAFNHDGRDDKLIRICFAKKKETLDEACLRMQKLLA